MTALNVNDLVVEEKALHVPSLDELVNGKLNSVCLGDISIFCWLALIYCVRSTCIQTAPRQWSCFLCFTIFEFLSVLSGSLKTNFDDVDVTIVDCPDLTQAPFHLAGSGLGGSSALLEIGGPPFLLPLVDRSKIYELVSICQKILPNASDILTVGAGAGPHPLIGCNCEVSVS